MISKNEETKKTVTYNVEVTKARAIKTGTYAFDMVVNGITVHDCFYKEGISEKTGKEYNIVSTPTYKGKDGKYYNIVWFPISKELTENIAQQISKLI